jgi:hypothetical protein
MKVMRTRTRFTCVGNVEGIAPSTRNTFHPTNEVMTFMSNVNGNVNGTYKPKAQALLHDKVMNERSTSVTDTMRRYYSMVHNNLVKVLMNRGVIPETRELNQDIITKIANICERRANAEGAWVGKEDDGDAVLEEIWIKEPWMPNGQCVIQTVRVGDEFRIFNEINTPNLVGCILRDEDHDPDLSEIERYVFKRDNKDDDLDGVVFQSD